MRQGGVGALGWVVTPRLVGPLFPTSQIKSGWSRHTELGVRALGSALESWVVVMVRRQAPSGAPGNVAVFAQSFSGGRA